MSGRLPSLLSSFLSRGNIRGFIFDIADVAEWEGGSLEAVLDRAGKKRQWSLHSTPLFIFMFKFFAIKLTNM